MPGLKRLIVGVGGALALTTGAGIAADPPAPPELAARGAEVFASHGCGYCHENGGRSAGKGPQLMGTARDNSFITFRVMNGKEGRMPSFSGSIDGDQLNDLIAYIRSLK